MTLMTLRRLTPRATHQQFIISYGVEILAIRPPTSANFFNTGRREGDADTSAPEMLHAATTARFQLLAQARGLMSAKKRVTPLPLACFHLLGSPF